MDNFGLVSNVVELLRGKDASVWHEILERTLKGDDPYATRIPQVPILEVIRDDGITFENIMIHLQAKEKMEIDNKIITAFELEKKDEGFFIYESLRAYDGAVMIQFDPNSFGVEYVSSKSSGFGMDATVNYSKVVESALKHGFKHPSFASALYFRARFLDAHRYTEGTKYYIACMPIIYAEDKLPIIPVLEYDRYKGWSLGAQEIGPETVLDVSFGSGQGEHFSSTFVFALPR